MHNVKQTVDLVCVFTLVLANDGLQQDVVDLNRSKTIKAVSCLMLFFTLKEGRTCLSGVTET